MGTAWMHAANISPDASKEIKMLPILIANVVLGVFFAMTMATMVIHQMSVYSIFGNDPSVNVQGSPLNVYLADFMAKYGNNFRTFKHGAFHGFIGSIFFVLPIVAVSALWEQKSWKYIWITVGYWSITMMLIGGIICQFA